MLPVSDWSIVGVYPCFFATGEWFSSPPNYSVDAGTYMKPLLSHSTTGELLKFSPKYLGMHKEAVTRIPTALVYLHQHIPLLPELVYIPDTLYSMPCCTPVIPPCLVDAKAYGR
eukprot:97445-Pyramimonas_sp.AAC.1